MASRLSNLAAHIHGRALLILVCMTLSVVVMFGQSAGSPYPVAAFSPASITSSAVTNSPWAFQMQNQQNTGYSPQTVINSTSVANLNRLWFDSFGGLAGTPVVVGGIVYVDGGSFMTAVSESTGQLIWRDGPGGQTGLTYHTRVGVTVDNGNVFAGTSDNQLVSLNALTGALNWNVSIVKDIVGSLANYTGPEATPLVFNHKVIIGETLGDNGARGVVRAFDETSGALLWTIYTVPPSPITATNQQGYLNPDGSLSWATNGTFGCICGGGAVWNVPAVDPQTGVIYFGTGNPFPTGTAATIRSPSPKFSNLYSDSVLAVNSTNGNLVWYFQELPGDLKDHDQGMPIQLFTTTINGLPTEVVGAGGKAGYYYELDAKSGALIHKISVGIHLNELGTSPGIIYPGAGQGGINTFSSYNPTTNMIYTEANNNPDGCGSSCPPANSTLYGINASTGTIVWTFNMASLAPGVSSTNSIVFTSSNHFFYGLNALTGAVLWKFSESSGGSIAPWFSWGPPSVTDGEVFFTTLGTSTSGGLEALSLQSISKTLVNVSITLNHDRTSNQLSNTNFFTLTYVSNGVTTTAHLMEGGQTVQVNANTTMTISGKSSGSGSTERWCLAKSCGLTSFSSGPKGGTFNFVYYDALKQLVSATVLGGGTPTVKLSYSAIPSIPSSTDIPTILSAKLSTTVKTIWAVRGTTASAPSCVTAISGVSCGPTLTGERWTATTPTAWTITAAFIITDPLVYQNQFSVTFTTNNGDGTTTPPPGTFWYNAGTSVSILAKPNPGFAFVSWSATSPSIIIASKTSPSTTATIDGSGGIVAQFT